MFDTPILFLVFNRPKSTELVFESIRKLKPKQLFIAADGPRNNNEIKLCSSVKDIFLKIDWPCEVKTLYRTQNLGCRIAVSSAITWFFQNVEEGIILEDDCIPNESFFFFCKTLLSKYRTNAKVMHITGVNLLEELDDEYSYYCSKYPHIWGWATWRRAWSLYSLDVKDYKSITKNTFNTIHEILFWKRIFHDLAQNKINTWDYQWMLTIWRHNGMCLNTTKNFINNIGFGEDATHTVGLNPYLMNQFQIENISHPITLKIDKNTDEEFSKTVHFIDFSKDFRSLFKKILKLILNKP